IHYKGVSVISLKFDEATQRSITILLKFEPGASYPYHNHPGGEEIFVLQGAEASLLKVMRFSKF
ncbi:MAG TPA: cupin domain-containing protein, partial [Chitinophagaceae bacterium]|nr:cupin domain-containing protein [Chitinophagaceae bacterium]